MITMEHEDGFTILRGREKEDWIIAPWWPCSGRALMKVAPAKLRRAFVQEAAAFADEKFTDGE